MTAECVSSASDLNLHLQVNGIGFTAWESIPHRRPKPAALSELQRGFTCSFTCSGGLLQSRVSGCVRNGGGYPKISNQADCNTDCTALDYSMALLLSQHLKQKKIMHEL